ncbi:GWxTD domain-containing protein [bacterium]|nr:MAG: GWxTD domain-containing protein [bacterium]
MKFFRLATLIIAMFFFASLLQAQTDPGRSTGGPFFFVDAANVASKEVSKGRIEVFVKVAFSELLFTKFQSTLFRSQYEITYLLYDKKNNLIQREIQDKEIITDKYSDTESDLRFHFSRLTLNVEPGDYTLTTTITDKETQKFGQRKLSIPVKTFREKPIGISDLIFADRIQKDSLLDIVNIVPNVFKSFDNEFKRYLVYFEIYDSKFSAKRDSADRSPAEKETIKIKYKVLDKNQNVIVADSTEQVVSQFQTFSSVEIDKKDISYGKYILDVVVSRAGQRASSKAIFDVRLSTFTSPSMTSTAFDLDIAIKQLRHITRNINIGKILKGTQAEKGKFFEEFWKTKDPTPETERNELMEEYYRRIDYANRYFSSGYREGWDTDRGMVFVVMNGPDDIERHPYDSDAKPYEIWYFYEANLKLVFVDFSGVGDYELYNRQEFESYILLHR